MTFASYINTFLEEKGIDSEHLLEVEGPSGTNWIPVGCLVELMTKAPKHEQKGIKHTLIRIDFRAPGPKPVLDYFTHLAQAVAQ